MKPKIRPIRDLYFRFIKGTDLEGVLNAQHAADALQRAGFIEYVPHRTEPKIEHYRDTNKLKDLNEDAYEVIVHGVLHQYRCDQGLE